MQFRTQILLKRKIDRNTVINLIWLIIQINRLLFFKIKIEIISGVTLHINILS
jgi:hypothetical protein